MTEMEVPPVHWLVARGSHMGASITRKLLRVIQWWRYGALVIGRRLPGIERASNHGNSRVNEYWGRHTLRSLGYTSKEESRQYLEWIHHTYRYGRDEILTMHEEFVGKTILDYGCGPGNDTVSFLWKAPRSQVIAMDVSFKALMQARYHIGLWGFDSSRVRLVQVDDADPTIPLASDSVDHISCLGVLMHTTNPGEVLKEFYRVLKPGGTVQIMIYNRDSLYYHSYVAYARRLPGEKYHGLPVDEVFRASTDGEDCPVSIAYRSSDWKQICAGVGFNVEYRGGFVSETETYVTKRQANRALATKWFEEEHKVFLRNVQYDAAGLPYYEGKMAGIGGVYWLTKGV